MTTLSEQIIVDSAKRKSGESNAFMYDANFDDTAKYNRVCVSLITIPKTFYLFDTDDETDTFTLTESGSAPVTVSLVNANYTRKSLRSELASALDLVSPNGFTYVVSYPNDGVTTGETTGDSPDTGKLSFSVASVGTTTITLSFTANPEPIPSPSQPALSMGFAIGSTNVMTTTAGTATITSTQPQFMQKEASIFIKSDLIDQDRDQNLIELFGTASNSFGSIQYQQTDHTINSRKFRQGKTSFKVSLVDKNDKAIDLNNLDWLMVLTLYRQTDFENKFETLVDVIT